MACELPPANPPFSFLQVPAPPGLADVVETLWVARGTIAYGRERILPNVPCWNPPTSTGASTRP